MSHRTLHLDHSIVEAAGHHNITIFSLPIRLPSWKNLSFVSLSITKEDPLFHNHGIDCTITWLMLCIVFTQARDKAATPANIRVGYHATGI
jgi:hypothetical protein